MTPSGGSIPSGGGESGGGGQSGGYNVPISLSQAETTALPQNLAAGTVFNFSSPGASGDWYNLTANPDQAATATSSAATDGDASTSSLASKLTGGNLSNGALLAIGGVALVGIGVAAYLLLRKK